MASLILWKSAVRKRLRLIDYLQQERATALFSLKWLSKCRLFRQGEEPKPAEMQRIFRVLATKHWRKRLRLIGCFNEKSAVVIIPQDHQPRHVHAMLGKDGPEVVAWLGDAGEVELIKADRDLTTTEVRKGLAAVQKHFEALVTLWEIYC